MTVAELSELRRLLRDGNFEYRIVKNTLAKIASQHTPVAVAKDSFKGPVGIAISYDDPVLAVKKILEYSKKNEKLKVNSGVIEGIQMGYFDPREGKPALGIALGNERGIRINMKIQRSYAIDLDFGAGDRLPGPIQSPAGEGLRWLGQRDTQVGSPG